MAEFQRGIGSYQTTLPTIRAISATVFAGGLPVRNPKALFDHWSGFRGHALGEDKLQSARITFRIHTSMARIADRRVRKIQILQIFFGKFFAKIEHSEEPSKLPHAR